MTTPEAIEAVKEGGPVPNRDALRASGLSGGRSLSLFRHAEGRRMGRGIAAPRKGDWQFQWFNKPDKTINMSENTARCQSCHQSQSGSDYLFTGCSLPRLQRHADRIENGREAMISVLLMRLAFDLIAAGLLCCSASRIGWARQHGSRARLARGCFYSSSCIISSIGAGTAGYPKKNVTGAGR